MVWKTGLETVLEAFELSRGCADVTPVLVTPGLLRSAGSQRFCLPSPGQGPQEPSTGLAQPSWVFFFFFIS